MSQNKSVEEWNDDMQYAYDSILFNHNPIEADKPFGEMLERVLTKLVEKTRQTSQEREREIVEELLSWLPDAAGRYDYAWDECTSEEQDAVKEIRKKYTTLTNPNKD